MWKMMEKNLEQAAERMKCQHDKHVKPSRQYQPGDRVYLDASKIKTTRTSKKLNAKFHGPFKAISAVRKSAYNSNYLLNGVFTMCFMNPNLNRLMNHNSPNKRKRGHDHHLKSLMEMKNTRLKKSKEFRTNKEKSNSL
jgi:hypothetical protein